MRKLFLAAALASLGYATAASATTWTMWSDSYTAGFPTGGSATGTMGGVTVSYSGEINSGIGNPPCGGICFGYPSWTPTSTWAGGIVTSAPPSAYGAIQLTGGAGTGTDTIIFSTPVTRGCRRHSSGVRFQFNPHVGGRRPIGRVWRV
jgi:hypothetical protein